MNPEFDTEMEHLIAGWDALAKFDVPELPGRLHWISRMLTRWKTECMKSAHDRAELMMRPEVERLHAQKFRQDSERLFGSRAQPWMITCDASVTPTSWKPHIPIA